MNSAVGRFLEIRQLAQLVYKENGNNLYSTIDELCWLALEREGNAPVKTCQASIDIKGPPKPKVNLLSLAAHFNLLPLAKALLEEGIIPISHNHLFPPPMELASRAGNSEILELFQEHLPEFDETGEVDCRWNWNWQAKVSPDSITGAVIREDMGLLKLSLYPPSRGAPHSTDVLGQPYGRISPGSSIGKIITRIATSETRSPDIYRYLETLLAERFGEDDLLYTLVLHAKYGNLVMVRYLLDRGIAIDGSSQRQTALIAACEGSHDEVVDFLLARGADPNVGAKQSQWITALSMAASSGSLAIVRKLLDHGALINEEVEFWAGYRRPAIWWAIAIEHMEMFQLLLERGASLEGYIGSTALEMAHELSMISMVEVLQSIGITIIEPVVDSGCAPWKQWAYYPEIYSVTRAGIPSVSD